MESLRAGKMDGVEENYAALIKLLGELKALLAADGRIAGG